jgi:hypothetical protein
MGKIFSENKEKRPHILRKDRKEFFSGRRKNGKVIFLGMLM